MNYEKVYWQLFDHAKSRKLSKKDCYIEQHHIIPRAEGGTDGTTIEAIRIERTGKHWFTNGKRNRFRHTCPKGFWLGRILKK